MDDIDIYLTKARESLVGAASEYSNMRLNNCANRCYYACFQAAIAELLRGGTPQPASGKWRHEFVKGQFVGQLINRRKKYPGHLRDVLERLSARREIADYRPQQITETEARRGLNAAREFVHAVEQGGEHR